MIRLHLVVEGQTEEEFANSVLVQHLAQRSVFADVRAVETSRQGARIFRGGVLDYDRARRDLVRWMKQDGHPECHFSTMFDLYALPSTFPGYEDAKKLVDPAERVLALESAMRDDIGHERFVPYLQLHEFEALVLADPRKLAGDFIERANEINRLVEMVAGFETPELIDDDPETAPSKRIVEQIPEYAGRKASVGPRVAREIGLTLLREKCPHFGAWLGTLESLACP